MESAGGSRKRASPPFLKKLQLYFSDKDREGLFLYLYYYIKPIILKPIINKPIFFFMFYIYTPLYFLKIYIEWTLLKKSESKNLPGGLFF